MKSESETKDIPRERSFDSTLALLRDPYRYVSERCRAHGSDLFETRLRLQRTICLTGKEAAELFYDETLFSRKGAAPKRIQKTLFGEGGVQGLDGEAHRHRKALFMQIMSPERVTGLARASALCWRGLSREWVARPEVNLTEVSREVLTRAVCSWAGVPLTDAETPVRVRQLTALFDAAGAVGPRHWASRRARKRAEAWTGELVEQVRSRQLRPPEGCALQEIAFHRDEKGEVLSSRTAAVELLNVLRPTVAVSIYIAFVALALRRDEAFRRKLMYNDDEYAECFAQETRRYYPFFPAVIARTRKDFEWKGYRFPAGRLALLDLYGTNHDARQWEDPDQFRPERFQKRAACPFSLIPQGGGDPHVHHRCPGEGAAVALMKVAADFLVNEISYRVPEQDLSIDWRRLPALPRSGFIISDLRRL